MLSALKRYLPFKLGDKFMQNQKICKNHIIIILQKILKGKPDIIINYYEEKIKHKI